MKKTLLLQILVILFLSIVCPSAYAQNTNTPAFQVKVTGKGQPMLFVPGATCSEWGALSDRKTMAYSMSEMMGNDLREDIALIKVPVLVLAAYKPLAQYPQFTKEYVDATFKKQYDKCKTCVIHVSPSAKHFLMYDAREWFLEEIDNFTRAL